MTVRYEQFRREYTAAGLSRDMLDACPMHQFEKWFEQATAAQLNDPTAMVLGTVDEQGAPRQRIVLLKGLSEGGFVFYTNYHSDKARAIEREPRVCLHFPWNALDRQVIVTGAAQKTSSAESAAYFASRPRESQIAAWASRQSEAISDRAALEKEALRIRERFGDGDIPKPEFWGGYRVLPTRMEFWQGGEHRLHDRFVYRRGAGREWEIEQLQP
ncbi:MAG: pyridoxamine 5'-phosphate oxidase [Halioglobus sp.]|nr:pyridoxamine 5'-phosphate oxidase [Halioglobus sp.]